MHLDPDLPDLIGGTAIGALLVDGDSPPNDVLLEPIERELYRGAALLVGLGVRLWFAGQRLDRLLLDPLGRVLALELVDHLGGLVQGGPEAVLHLAQDGLVHLRRSD